MTEITEGTGSQRRNGATETSILELVAIHDALDAVLDYGHVEVDQQTNRTASEAQVGEQLGAVNRSQRFYRLQLEDDSIVDEHVYPARRVDSRTAILERHRDAHIDRVPPGFKLDL